MAVWWTGRTTAVLSSQNARVGFFSSSSFRWFSEQPSDIFGEEREGGRKRLVHEEDALSRRSIPESGPSTAVGHLSYCEASRENSSLDVPSATGDETHVTSRGSLGLRPWA